jgi:phage tail tape-measure protein
LLSGTSFAFLIPAKGIYMATATFAEKSAKNKTRCLRAAVFTSVEQARQAVSGLLAAGFTREQITVVTSDPQKAAIFHEFEHQEPAGVNTPAAMAAGGAIGATVGSIATGAVGVATGGIPLIVAGGIGLMAGAVWGSFLGAMMTRGIEKEAANFYDQEVQRGNLLVTVDECVENGPTLEDANRVFAAAGAAPMPLPEG